MPFWDERTVDAIAFTERAAQQATGASEAGQKVVEEFSAMAQAADHATWYAIFPLALASLILHELYESTKSGNAFRVREIFLRVGVIVALLLGYGMLVRTITSIAGGWGHFASFDDIMGPVTRGLHAQIESRTDSEGFFYNYSDIAGFVIYLMIFMIIAVCALFAFAAMLFLSISQGVLLAIIVALGKPCLVVSIVPGISLGKSWARYLAMVAAWTTVGGTATKVILSHKYAVTIEASVQTQELTWMLQGAGIYLVLGFFTIAVPSITSGLFSGAASQAHGATAAMAGTLLAGRMLMRGGSQAGRSALGLGRGKQSAPAGAGVDGARPHKMDRDAFGPGPVPKGGSLEHQAPGHAVYAGQAARAFKADREAAAGLSMPRQQPLAELPQGRPGAAAFMDDPGRSDAEKEAYVQRVKAPLSEMDAAPPQNRPMEVRAHEQQATLQHAYPDMAWDAQQLNPEERAILSELDHSHGRFSGWESGAQGRGDFDSARQLAGRRLEAMRQGYARPAAAYQAGASAKSSAGGPLARAPKAEQGSTALAVRGDRAVAPARPAKPNGEGNSALPSQAAAALPARGEQARPALASAPAPRPAQGESSHVHPRIVRSNQGGKEPTRAPAGDRDAGRIHKLEPKES